MLTKVTIRNFKHLEEAVIDLDSTVVFIGPNNSGKTSALQALALWEAGMRAWIGKRTNSEASKRSGVTLNRKELIPVSIPSADLLWRNRHVRSRNEGKTRNILIDILVEGVSEGKAWECGFEFDYANPESFYCRPLRRDAAGVERYPVPELSLIQDIRMSFLPAMSGLASIEPRSERGRINVLIGEGQTAQVLRNLCFGVLSESPEKWNRLSMLMSELFGVKLIEPRYLSERGEIVMSYRDQNGIDLDLSSAGRGLRQLLLLFSYLFTNPGTVLLLDEPDAHLEILRQRQVYNLLQEISAEQGCQIIAASHSEVVLNEAIDRDTVIAFVGKPHRIEKSQQLLKALQTYGFEHYYQAEEKGWVLYLEGSTDLSILRSWAKVLKHPAARALELPFVHYLQTNSPNGARDHFHALQEANPRLRGIAIFDRIEVPLRNDDGLRELMWKRREIENYLDDFLEPLFKRYAEKAKSTILRKSRFHELASLMTVDEIDGEVKEKLNAIALVADE